MQKVHEPKYATESFFHRLIVRGINNDYWQRSA
ncbi:hypothetical protein LCGC14_2012180, partial [marine sediment metagenome]